MSAHPDPASSSPEALPAARVREALEAANLPALMMSIVHMTGDASLLDGPIRPAPPTLTDVSGGLSEAEREAVLDRATEAFLRFRSETGGSDGAHAAKGWIPPRETLEAMMSFCAGEPLCEAHRALGLEELALHDADPRRRDIDPAAVARANEAGFHVVIIGAGMSGLLLALRLAQQGIDFTVLEKNDGVGGTWFENRYPGCRVDIASFAYSYSFDDRVWDSYFGEHTELRANFARLAREHRIESKIRFGAEVLRAVHDEEAGTWQVDFRQHGEVESLVGTVVVSAVGQMNRPRLPEIEGRERFAGPQMHTAEWNEDTPLDGRRVAVVGTGASAFQLVPELGKRCAQVTVFQRQPPWMYPNPGYHEKVDAAHRFCLEQLPGYARWYRFMTIWFQLDKAHDRIQIDPDWDDGGLSCSPANRAFRDDLVAYIHSQIEDETLAAAVTPAYPPFGTRTLQDNGSWLATLQKDNVALVPEAVEEVTPDGVRTTTGRHVEVDVLVWATGFHTNRFLWPMDIVGRDGVRLADAWQPVPKAYLGITVPRFPNLYCLYGPNTNVAHTGNCIMVSEFQTTYILSCLAWMLEDDLASIECRAEPAEGYEARLDEALSATAWAAPQVESYYRVGHTGRVVSNMPWSMAEYRTWTHVVDRDDYAVRPRTRTT
ncbi:MAG: NAD(P)/FAD-dependent oxidoreductase [Myxococcota bacterium]